MVGWLVPPLTARENVAGKLEDAKFEKVRLRAGLELQVLAWRQDVASFMTRDRSSHRGGRWSSQSLAMGVMGTNTAESKATAVRANPSTCV